MTIKNLTAFIIFILLGINVLGFLTFSSINNCGQQGCAISLALENDCPDTAEGSAAFALHHISGVQNLTRSIIMLNVSLATPKLLSETSAPRFFRGRTENKTAESIFEPQKQFLRWLALRHKRDPRAFYRTRNIT